MLENVHNKNYLDVNFVLFLRTKVLYLDMKCVIAAGCKKDMLFILAIMSFETFMLILCIDTIRYGFGLAGKRKQNDLVTVPKQVLKYHW